MELRDSPTSENLLRLGHGDDAEMFRGNLSEECHLVKGWKSCDKLVRSFGKAALRINKPGQSIRFGGPYTLEESVSKWGEDVMFSLELGREDIRSVVEALASTYVRSAIRYRLTQFVLRQVSDNTFSIVIIPRRFKDGPVTYSPVVHIAQQKDKKSLNQGYIYHIIHNTMFLADLEMPQ